MAVASSDVLFRLTPLQTTTNSPPNATFTKHSSLPASNIQSKPLRRTNSLRRIQLKSDDSSPSSPDSIYNAERVDSVESLSEIESVFQLPPPAVPIPKLSDTQSGEPVQKPTGTLSRSLSSSSPPLGYSNWPVPQLDTILEQSSTRTLRQPASAPRLRLSPQRSARYVKAQRSIHSIRPIRSDCNPWAREKHHPAAGVHRQHSYSTTDLDCLKRIINSKDADSALGRPPFYRTASQIPVFPIKPKHPPPQFPQTPEGLPKFGSKEAQQLRLNPLKQQRHRARALFSWLRGDRESEEQHLAATSNSVTSPVSSSGEHPPNDLLKRLFGMTRPVLAPDSIANPTPRASLPAGVTTANSPGVLAVADDGTPVRGKFGARASGHGVGSRNLESHPMVRRDRQAVIQEQVEQIDKTCERINRGSERNHLRQLPQFPSIETELERHVTRAAREIGGRISGLEARSGNVSLESPPIPPANSPSQAPTISVRSSVLSASTRGVYSASTHDPSMFSGMRSVRSASSSIRMVEPR